MKKNKIINIASGSLILIVLYIISLDNYLLFHSIAEGFSIITAFIIFIIAWNSRNLVNNSFFMFLGTAMLFVGGFDFLHTLSYEGMVIFKENGSNRPTQLWICARYIQGFSILISPLFLNRKIKTVLISSFYSLISILLFLSIFYWKIFPECFNETTGLTLFKKASEYLITFIFFCSAVHLPRYRDKFESHVFTWIVISIALSMMSEIAFTEYAGAYSFLNLIGHYFKIVSFWFLYKAFIVINLNDPYMSIFRDLKQSEERYRSLFNNMLNGFARHKVIFDAHDNPIDYIYLDVNEAFEKITGHKRASLIGRKVTEVIQGIEKDSANWIGRYGRVSLTGEPERFESFSESMQRWYSIHVFSIEKGFFVTIFEDITEKKLADQAMIEEQGRLETRVEQRNRELSRANELLTTVIDNMPVMLCLFDSEGHVQLINKEYKNLTGWDIEETEDSAILRSAAAKKESHRHIISCIKEEPPGWNDFFLKKLEGEDLATSWAGAMLSDGSIIAIGIDLTDRKKMEMKLLNYTEQLERSNRDLEEFAYIASHDLQEPLRKIRTFGDLLSSRSSDALNETGRDYVERMQNASQRMQNLIDSLLTYSRISTREKVIIMVDLNKAVASALSNLDLRIEEKKAKIEYDNLPTIEADRIQMVQLFQNLIGNSLKFHKENVPPLIRISARKSLENSVSDIPVWQITIEDNGLGFEQKYADQIFGPFQRLHGRGVYEGVGMGLAICKKIVARHSGRLTATSIPGEGTTFTITLPEKYPA